MLNFRKKPKTKMVKIGPLVTIDPQEITAMYVDEDSLLVIRISGAGIIKLNKGQLEQNYMNTMNRLMELKNAKTS